MTDRNAKALSQSFEEIVGHYLENCNSVRNTVQKINPELEIRFGTNSKVAKPISVVDYQNVVKTLISNGWYSTSYNMTGVQMLRIIPERLVGAKPFFIKKGDEEKKEKVAIGEEGAAVEKGIMEGGIVEGGIIEGGGRTKMISSNIRAEIEGSQDIQYYCQHNSLDKMYNTAKFTQKKNIINPKTEKHFERLDYEEFNFRVSYQEEEDYKLTSTYMPIKKTLYDWPTTRKIFRSINRVRFRHDDFPVFVDISIVKTNLKNKVDKRNKHQNQHQTQRYGTPIPTDTIQESDVFNNVPIYEIELEMDNKMMSIYHNRKDAVKELMVKIKKCIRFVLSGLQETAFPISYTEQSNILNAYMCRIHGDSWLTTRNPYTYFIGPQSVALQLENVVENKEMLSSTISIQKKYTVTEKADGQRALLYIAKDGRMYMISGNLKVIFTGSMTEEKGCFDSLLDGEFIMYGKNKEVIYLYAAFDIYYFGGLEKGAHVRPLPFSTNDETALNEKYRLPLLKKFHAMCKVLPVTPDAKCEFRFRCKHFEQCVDDGLEQGQGLGQQSIYEASSSILSKTHEYEVDGLIFTPMDTGVGGDKPNEASPLGKKYTWKQSFKWKPPEYNTIDFLVHIKKDKDGHDLIRYIAHDGETMMSKMIPYKTLILNVGFDKKKHKHMNVFHDVLYDSDEYFKNMIGQDNEDSYEAMPFVPTDPYNAEAYLCHIEMDGNNQMKTLEGDTFDGDMVVEFQYAKDDNKKKGPWKWVPLRLRQDKTQALMEGIKLYNNYTTADTNWKSIHYPVTESMITGKEDIPKVEIADTVYYNLTDKDESTTIALREFHNYVKRRLIENISSYLRTKANVKEPLLIDFAVGKAGDLSKWVFSQIKFVLGIDIHGDNITNPYNGACIRYLRHRHKNRNSTLRGLFIEGNSSLNIRTAGTAFKNATEKELVQSVFGQGKNTNDKKYVFKHGIAHEGFHISSCQFSLHYFFENTKTLHNFLQNIAECTRLHGYFVGTCFDGEEIFKFLYKHKDGSLIRQNETIRIDKNGRKMFEITKKYNSVVQEFKTDESSVGLPIQVYQESIDKTFVEYLVNFEYFVRLMADYGFVLVEKDELRQMRLPESTGLFKRLFDSMENDFRKSNELQKDYKTALQMTYQEKTVSFLNRYFIFKKMTELSKTTLSQMQTTILSEEGAGEKTEKEDVMDKVKKDNKPEIIKLKKHRKKMGNTKIGLTEDNYSPEETDISGKLVFDNPEIQTFYGQMTKSQLKYIESLPMKERKSMVTFWWKNIPKK